MRSTGASIVIGVVGFVVAVSVTAGCGGGGGGPAKARVTSSTSASASPRTSRTPAPPASTPSVATTTEPPFALRVGETLTGGELAARFIDTIGGQTFDLTTTMKNSTVSCVVIGNDFDTVSVKQPVPGVREVRVFGSQAYILDRPTKKASWFSFDMASGETALPEAAQAKALNRLQDVWPGACTWNERLAAIDPSGDAKVVARTAQGWRLSVATDPETTTDKFSDSARPYAPATWEVDREGRPVSYRSAGSTRVVTFSGWRRGGIPRPAEEQVHQ